MSEKPRRVQFFPRQVIEGMPHGDPRAALISITSPGDAPARLPDGWAAVLRLVFDDVTPPFPLLIRAGAPVPEIIPFDTSLAAKVLAFVEALPSHVDRILVHCKAGVSRSPAVAQFLAEKYGYLLQGRTDGANPHVLSVLRQTNRPGDPS